MIPSGKRWPDEQSGHIPTPNLTIALPVLPQHGVNWSAFSEVSSVPQMSRSDLQIELSTAQYAQYAHTFFLSIFVSVANKGCPDQIPKLEVAGSIPVTGSIILSGK